jgi:hypothetical protein
MNFALVVVAALGAGPTDAVQVFSWETASPVVWLEERRAGPNAKPPKPFEWKGFFKIRSNGQLPENGVFQVADWPVQPEVEWLSRGLRYRKNAPPVVVGPNSGGQFDLLVREPGRYTFKASVGKVWSSQVTIEAKTFPFELGMRQPDFLEKYGNPDVALPNGRWIYKHWTALAVYFDPQSGMQANAMRADVWQAYLAEAALGESSLASDLSILIGSWNVQAKSNRGVWVFRADGTAVADNRISGFWTEERLCIRVVWNNGCWGTFSRPLAAQGVTGDSWIGPDTLRATKQP